MRRRHAGVCNSSSSCDTAQHARGGRGGSHRTRWRQAPGLGDALLGRSPRCSTPCQWQYQRGHPHLGHEPTQERSSRPAAPRVQFPSGRHVRSGTTAMRRGPARHRHHGTHPATPANAWTPAGRTSCVPPNELAVQAQLRPRRCCHRHRWQQRLTQGRWHHRQAARETGDLARAAVELSVRLVLPHPLRDHVHVQPHTSMPSRAQRGARTRAATATSRRPAGREGWTLLRRRRQARTGTLQSRTVPLQRTRRRQLVVLVT